VPYFEYRYLETSKLGGTKQIVMTLLTSQETVSGAHSTLSSKPTIQDFFKECREATPKSLADDSWYLIVVSIFKL
jgi:hypothetical protein